MRGGRGSHGCSRKNRASMSPRARVLLIGPTPPPYHGVSVAVDMLLYSRLQDAFKVSHLELADRRGIGHVNKPDLHDVWLFIRQWLTLIRLLLARRPRVTYLVLSQSTIGFLRDSFFLWPAWLLGACLVVHLHGGAFRHWYERRWFPMRAYIRTTLRLVKTAIVLGESLRGQFAGLVPERSIVVVPNGVRVVDDWTDRTFPAEDRPWRILYLNTLNRMKGALVLLAAIPTVLRRRRDVEFIFAGPWSHEDHRREAMQYIAQHQLDCFVTFSGQVTGDEKAALLHSADLFVFPGIQPEGQPLVVLEAMGASLPVVFTDQGCLRETVVDGEGGIEAYTNDPYDLAGRILWLLDRPDECRRLGQNGKRQCRELFNKDRYINRMIQVLGDAATESSTLRYTPLFPNSHGSPHV